MPTPESDTKEPIPISARQHWCYCPRQCGLIHLEQAFAENVHTLRGRALPLFHDRLGLVGKADAVEFEAGGNPYPVEYKHGSRHKRADIAACDELQLAAQALCLEAMTGKAVPEGALFYAKSKRRRAVPITPALRCEVEKTAADVRAMLASGEAFAADAGPHALQGMLAEEHLPARSGRGPGAGCGYPRAPVRAGRAGSRAAHPGPPARACDPRRHGRLHAVSHPLSCSMLVIVCYDVNTETRAGRRRLRRVAKVCEGSGSESRNRCSSAR